MGGDAPLQAAIRQVPALPAPRVPPPGPVDIAVGRLLHRIAPFQPCEIAALSVLLGLDGGPPSPGRAARTLIPAGCDPAAQHRLIVAARERFRYRGQELRATQLCYLTAYPVDTVQHATSSLNFAAGKTVPNLVELPLGPAIL